MHLSTRRKIQLAIALQKPVIWFMKLLRQGPLVKCSRGGVNWELDLREGIDFSIFLLGCFEPSTSKALAILVQSGDYVIDIGANVGAHTLPLASLVGEQGKVIAFEPTQYAYSKLEKNVFLNPFLKERISAHQYMLADHMRAHLEEAIFSSWPLKMEAGLHSIHGGREMSTAGADVSTLDYFFQKNTVPRLDLIKMDVDGHECTVIKGSQNTLQKYMPTIIMEFAPYTLRERGESPSELLDLLKPYGYLLFDEKTGVQLPWSFEELSALVPKGGSRNIIAAISPPFAGKE